jgi:hypothetical protein
MNTDQNRRRPAPSGRLLMAGIAGVATLWLGAPAAHADPLADSADRQSGIATQAKTVAEELDATVAAFRENGLGDGEDVRTLTAVRDVLGKLSAEQMREVAELLRRAHGPGDVAVAYAQQQDIVAKLRSLLAKYQREQRAAALSTRLNQLADRQEANLRSTVEQARASAAKQKGKDPSADQAEQLHGAQAEQRQLKGAVAEAMADLKALGQQTDADPRAAAAARRADDVSTKAVVAADDLSAGRLMRAATGEQDLRDQLRDLARQVGPASSRSEQLQRTAERIDAAIAEQKRVIADTQSAWDKPKLAAAGQKQGAVADQTDQARRDAADAAPAAAAALKGAADSMRQADTALSASRRDAAAKQEQSALAQLQQARAAVADAARADAASTDPAATDPAAQVAELKREQQALADRAAVRKGDHADPAALAADQAKLAERTRNLQSDLADANPAAAAAADAAAAQMSAAQRSLDHGHRSEAVPKQREAVADLDKVSDAINKQAAAAEQQRQALAQTTAARDQVANALDKQADAAAAASGTKPAGDPKSADAKKSSDAQKAASDQQRQAAAAADAAAKAIAAAPPEARKAAADAVNSARQAMAQAQQKLEQSDPSGAKPQQQDALAKLADAKAKLDQQVDQMQQKAGQPTPPDQAAAALANLAAQLHAAGALASTGAGESKAGQNGPAGGPLEQAAAAAAKGSAADQGLLGDAGRASMQQAQADLQKAADAAAKGQSQQAADAAAAAQQSMADAMMSAQVAASTASAQPTPGAKPPEQPTPGGGGDNAKPGGPAVAAAMPRANVAGSGAFVGLPPRDRAAVEQAQRDPVPAEYGGMVEQYYRNLADAPANAGDHK